MDKLHYVVFSLIIGLVSINLSFRPFWRVENVAWEEESQEVQFSAPTFKNSSPSDDNNMQTFLLPPDEPNAELVNQVASTIVLNSSRDDTSPLEHCPVTCQVQLLRISSPSPQYNENQKQQHQEPWRLQTIDSSGRNKTVGGDEFYVTYADDGHPGRISAAAWVFDDQRNNGSYLLDFVSHPMLLDEPLAASNWTGRGTLSIYYQYTCGTGHIAPPLKSLWKTGGAARTAWTLTNITAPPIRHFQPPADVSLEAYNQTLFIGDSIMEQFIQEHRRFFLPTTRVYIRGNVGSHLSTKTVSRFMHHVQRSHGSTLTKTGNGTKLAVVLGSAIWDILADDAGQEEHWSDHLVACRQYIQAFREKYPHVDIYWKSASAVHIHRISDGCYRKRKCVQRIRYMSQSRSHSLYQAQKKVMQELKVPVLDVYEAYYLSADQSIAGDGRHYKPEINALMLSWFYPNSSVAVQQVDSAQK